MSNRIPCMERRYIPATPTSVAMIPNVLATTPKIVGPGTLLLALPLARSTDRLRIETERMACDAGKMSVGVSRLWVEQGSQ